MLNVYRYDSLKKSENNEKQKNEINQHKIKTDILNENHIKRAKDFMFKVN